MPPLPPMLPPGAPAAARGGSPPGMAGSSPTGGGRSPGHGGAVAAVAAGHAFRPLLGAPGHTSPPREPCWEGGWGETCASAAMQSAQREASREAAAADKAARGNHSGLGAGGAEGFRSELSYGNFGLEDSALIRNLDSLLLDEPDLN